jgi:integrase
MRGRPPTGSVKETPLANGAVSYALRFTAYGARQFVTLGKNTDGWSRARADTELSNVLADVRRGIWRPTEAAPAPPPSPTFHVFASDWLAARAGDLQPTTYADYHWRLKSHLLPFFAAYLLSDVSVSLVDAYRDGKLREPEDDRLSGESINKTIKLLGAILDVAQERGLIESNPVRVNPRNRKVKVKRRAPVWLDSAEQIVALLDAASDLDAESARTSGRRAQIAALILAGPRNSESGRLTWRGYDPTEKRLFITDSKTEAGHRIIRLVPLLLVELEAHRVLTKHPTKPDDLMFPTARGTRRDKDNVRNRVVRPVVARATELLAERGQQPLPLRITPHTFRHTFASILFELGESAPSVMAQLGHTDANFTLKVYSHVMNRDAGARERLRALVNNEPLAAPVPVTPTLVRA